MTFSCYRHGILKAGDRILKVNDVDVSHASQMETHSLLRAGGVTCTLEIEYDVTVHGKYSIAVVIVYMYKCSFPLSCTMCNAVLLFFCPLPSLQHFKCIGISLPLCATAKGWVNLG